MTSRWQDAHVVLYFAQMQGWAVNLSLHYLQGYQSICWGDLSAAHHQSQPASSGFVRTEGRTSLIVWSFLNSSPPPWTRNIWPTRKQPGGNSAQIPPTRFTPCFVFAVSHRHHRGATLQDRQKVWDMKQFTHLWDIWNGLQGWTTHKWEASRTLKYTYIWNAIKNCFTKFTLDYVAVLLGVHFKNVVFSRFQLQWWSTFLLFWNVKRVSQY